MNREEFSTLPLTLSVCADATRRASEGATTSRRSPESRHEAEGTPVQRLWRAPEVAAYLGVPVATLHQWRYHGRGPDAFRVGRHLRYDPAAVNRWLHEQCSGQGS